MKRLLAAALSLLAAAQCSGQALKSGFEHLRNQRLDDAAKVFSKALAKGTESLAASYGMGCIVSNPSYQNYNAAKGFRLLRNANDRFQASSPKTKQVCRDVYGFGFYQVRAAMIKAADIEWQNVSSKNTAEYYQWFIETFDGADSLVHMAICRKAELGKADMSLFPMLKHVADVLDNGKDAHMPWDAFTFDNTLSCAATVI